MAETSRANTGEKVRISDDAGSGTTVDARPSIGSAMSRTIRGAASADTVMTPGQSQQQDSDVEARSEARVAPEESNYSVFTTWEKRAIVLGAAAGAFFSPLSGQIYFPALNVLAEDLHVTASQINLTVTTYMIFQGITPMFVGTFADATGRRPAYLFCFVVYIAANIGCALAPNYVALLILRSLQSAGASTTIALCQAVVSDVITSAERGQYVGWTTVPIILAPSLGPVLGGIFSQYLGWRWIFWFLTISSGFVFFLYALFMPETCRTIVGDGSVRPHPAYRTFWQLIKDAWRKHRAARGTEDLSPPPTTSRASTKPSFHMKSPNPARSLLILFETEMFLLLGYSSFIFAGFYAIATALPVQLRDIYGFDDLKIGLMYLPLGGGSILSAFSMGKLANWNYRRHCKKLNFPFDRQRQQDLSDFPIEKARLEISMPQLAIFTLILVAWGWALQSRPPLAVPIVLLFLIGVSLVGFSNSINILIVDINTGQAGAATAANNLTRCLVGAAATAVINPLINSIGAGWSFTILALVYTVFSPVLYLVMRNGMKWRKAKLEKRQKREKRKRERAQQEPAATALAAEKPPVQETSQDSGNTAVMPEVQETSQQSGNTADMLSPIARPPARLARQGTRMFNETWRLSV
ncbi:Uu.00g055900.m01.CDS01 [Anthostomella pinea]|uniref:Uu.00g055900.m01.CDS01 n=1 Tax=Anthostomella pinea TaxID=933095 RepID=A0AAI8YPT5_9PEZI|nr:Uu.00g055900.m01.CDS01 [Anthostomella pinea]